MSFESKKDDQKQSVDAERLARRDFLAGLGKWSAVVIGAVGGALIGGSRNADAYASRWVNRRVGGGAWANRAYRPGGAWANRGIAGNTWANRRVGGGAWANRYGGGGAWANRRW